MNNILFPVLSILSDGKFHSGEKMSGQLNVSRSSVWMAVENAGQIGVKIFSVRGKGYKLTHPIQLLDKNKIKLSLGEISSRVNIEVLDVVNSTNSYLLKESAKNIPHASCIAANIQTHGKGRRGRHWQSALGESLTFSYLWRFNFGPASLSGLSLTIGIALIRSLKTIGINDALVKWPNDILIFNDNSYKKLAGILIELQGDSGGQSAAIIGVGINLNLSKNQLNKIDQPAIDINQCLGNEVNPNEFLGILLNNLTEVLSIFQNTQFSSFKDEWISYHAYQDKPVKLILGNNEVVEGRVLNISLGGSLVIQTDKGERSFTSGEISIKEFI